MKIVIDSNRIIAALIKESTTRKIIFDKNFEFFAPEQIRHEINEHRNEIISKISVAQDEFDLLESIIFSFIKIIQQKEYSKVIDKLRSEIDDINDLPFLAVCLLINAEGIWTHDPHFLKQRKCNVLDIVY